MLTDKVVYALLQNDYDHPIPAFVAVFETEDAARQYVEERVGTMVPRFSGGSGTYELHPTHIRK